MVSRQIRVSGHVQGVGYRDALLNEAARLGVTGWVRNRADGSVEALLQGSDESVKHLMDWARRGPPAARVCMLQEVDPEASPVKPHLRFERWPNC